MGYFRKGGKYYHFQCCNDGCGAIFTTTLDDLPPDAWFGTTPPSENDEDYGPKYALVSSKVGVHMCKRRERDECNHMLCVDCFNAKQGLVGKACQYTEEIGIAGRKRQARGCTQKGTKQK